MEIIRIKESGVHAAATKAAVVLRSGGIILYPTDTLYGLGVDASNKDALLKLYALKKRSIFKTALIAVPTISSIEEYGHMTGNARVLADRFLPGALTLVLKAKEGILQEIVRDDGTVGIRMPNDPFCLVLNKVFDSSYTSTSANISEYPTAPSVEEILTQFGEHAALIDLVIDDGPRAGGIPSTIVSCVGDEVTILRDGALSREILGL